MDNLHSLQTESSSAEDTKKLAKNIGQQLKGGEVIKLISDLGGGKTTFVQGLAEGLGSKDVVSSPSFTIANLYRAEKLRLYHFDFYRLEDPGILLQELKEILLDPQAVVVIEWANIVEAYLPHDHLDIELIVSGLNSRQVTITYPKRLDYLIKELDN